jgi:hypothetical protein
MGDDDQERHEQQWLIENANIYTVRDDGLADGLAQSCRGGTKIIIAGETQAGMKN